MKKVQAGVTYQQGCALSLFSIENVPSAKIYEQVSTMTGPQKKRFTLRILNGDGHSGQMLISVRFSVPLLAAVSLRYPNAINTIIVHLYCSGY